MPLNIFLIFWTKITRIYFGFRYIFSEYIILGLELNDQTLGVLIFKLFYYVNSKLIYGYLKKKEM